ncbi:MAG: hypothetical protein J7619_20640 [Dyadobacter sp.]|uniref:hypothetical protein n=1 Tax=Dyadobacter sp. TaxID=1914288 RepID=UPI001B1AD68C|nr:hypothetical protein [Dyadobacter sp.]MBO9615125.1 hypothetical protein [Dyadobacter sp.]
MDSKNLFIKSSTYFRLITWQRQNGEEWIYIGTETDFDSARAADLVSVLEGDEIYFVTDRHESKRVVKEDLIGSLRERIAVGNFILWDLSFDAVVEFNRIGVARQGLRF